MTWNSCETILYNGKVITVDQSFSIAQAVAIGGDRLTRVGTDDDLLAIAAKDTKLIDLRGRTVVPGFVDTHPHMFHKSIGRASSVPLMGLRSIEDIKRAIAARVKESPRGKWIIASPVGDPPYYFNGPGALEEGRWPTRWDLDEVSPYNPVYIKAYHCRVPNTAIVNSFGLRIMGVNKDTPSEEGGVTIVRDPGIGEPNGQLNGMHFIYNFSPLYRKLISVLPFDTFAETLDGLRAQMRDFNAAGITTIYEGHVMPPSFLLPYKALWENKELTVRVCFAYEIDTAYSLEEINQWAQHMSHASGIGFGDEWLKLCGATISVDGPIWHGCAMMRKPYLSPYGEWTTGGEGLISLEKFKQIALIAAKNNIRLNSCFAGDLAADIALEAYEYAHREIQISGKRWVLQHIEFPSRENIAKCKELGLSVTTSTNFEWGKGAECYVPRLGKAKAAQAIPLRQWLDAGVEVAQSTDYGPFEPMKTLWQSLKRVHGLTGERLAPPSEQITREEAIRIYTMNGAKVLFWEDQLGSIEIGKLADLVVLDKDILSCPLEEIEDAQVLMTIVGGKVVYER